MFLPIINLRKNNCQINITRCLSYILTHNSLQGLQQSRLYTLFILSIMYRYMYNYFIIYLCIILNLQINRDALIYIYIYLQRA